MVYKIFNKNTRQFAGRTSWRWSDHGTAWTQMRYLKLALTLRTKSYNAGRIKMEDLEVWMFNENGLRKLPALDVYSACPRCGAIPSKS